MEEQDGELYFTMLETTRQLNRERLSENTNAGAIHRLHAEYFASLVERAMSEHSTDRHGYWYSRLRIEHENLHFAFDWSVKNNESELSLRLAYAPRRYWRNFGFQKEGLLWIETALGLAEQASVLLRGGALMSAGDYCIDLGQVEKGVGYLSKALNIFKQVDDKRTPPGAWC